MDSGEQKEIESKIVPYLYLDEIQIDLYRLFNLYYSGLGIIQRDSPRKSDTSQGEDILRLENNIKEIIGQFIITKDRVLKRVSTLEEYHQDKLSNSTKQIDTLVNTRETDSNLKRLKEEDPEIYELIKRTRELDGILDKKIKRYNKELPLLNEYIEQLINETIE
ncbi:hypothetical protein NEOKW01_0213 [Nematocida sp. AWRm80]|nr:hypothetical protein NEOKW01_0213 [Nematocida sp. AWRm80]